MNQPLFFDSFESLLRVFFVGGAAYAALVVMLRVSGKRTLSKMNAFDLVITVALGSTLATALLDRNVPLVEGVAALALLVALQYVITWGSVRSRKVRELVKSEPTVLLENGVIREDAMGRQRVTREEVEAAIRQHGHSGVDSIDRVVLETDGSLSVVRRQSV